MRKLKAGNDTTREVDPGDLNHKTLTFASDPSQLKSADFFIVTVPTPIDDARRPDLTALLKASVTVGCALKSGDIVVYEIHRLPRRNGGRLRSCSGTGIGP